MNSTSGQDQADADRIAGLKLARRLRRLLHNHRPQPVAVALADCLAVWLAGHIVPGNQKATAELRGILFRDWTTLALQLAAEEAAQMEARIAPGGEA